MDYDAFGAPALLSSKSSGIERRERIFGGTSARVDFFDNAGNPVDVGGTGAAFQNFIERHIVSPIGTLAVLRRPNSGAPVLLYPIGDYQGTRAVLGSGANPAETISYEPYGGVVVDSGTPSSLTWWPYQWNGGHVLEGFGLVALGRRVLDPRTARFLQRDPLMPAKTARTAHPYAFAWNNPVKFTEHSGAQPAADQGGTVAGSMAASGSFPNVFRDPPVPGEKVEPQIEMDWTCDANHDCMKVVETNYGLTDFEKELRKEFHSGNAPKAWRWGPYYHRVLDQVSGAVIGYAMFQTNVVDIYDRQGRFMTSFGRPEPSAATWFQPGDFLAGPLAAAFGRAIGRGIATQGVRRVEALVEGEIADEAVTGGVAQGMARRTIPWKYDFNLTSALGRTSWEGDIYLNWGLQPGTELFEQTLLHEGVHRFLTPLRGLFVSQRQNLRAFFYENSHLLKFSEEAIAETVGSGSFSQGLRLGFANYGISGTRLVLEGLTVGVGYGGLWYGSYQLGQGLFGDQPSR
jgi:RHS repeat-associated protein